MLWFEFFLNETQLFFLPSSLKEAQPNTLARSLSPLLVCIIEKEAWRSSAVTFFFTGNLAARLTPARPSIARLGSCTRRKPYDITLMPPALRQPSLDYWPLPPPTAPIRAPHRHSYKRSAPAPSLTHSLTQLSEHLPPLTRDAAAQHSPLSLSRLGEQDKFSLSARLRASLRASLTTFPLHFSFPMIPFQFPTFSHAQNHLKLPAMRITWEPHRWEEKLRCP
jgi:hypothetical protein